MDLLKLFWVFALGALSFYLVADILSEGGEEYHECPTNKFTVIRDTCSNSFDTVSVDTIYNTVIEHLKEHEGLRLKPYNDGGALTIGYGHRILTGENLKAITKKQADSILRKDYNKKLDYVKNTFYLTGNKAHAIACFIFNIGEGRLEKNSILSREILRKGKIENQLLRYHYYNGEPHNGLKKRRLFELGLWKS